MKTKQVTLSFMVVSIAAQLACGPTAASAASVTLPTSTNWGTVPAQNSTPATASGQMPVRVLEFNIQYGCKGTDGKIDCAETANWIHSANADLVSIVEVLGSAQAS